MNPHERLAEIAEGCSVYDEKKDNTCTKGNLCKVCMEKIIYIKETLAWVKEQIEEFGCSKDENMMDFTFTKKEIQTFAREMQE